jgi:hypothetical protein
MDKKDVNRVMKCFNEVFYNSFKCRTCSYFHDCLKIENNPKFIGVM